MGRALLKKLNKLTPLHYVLVLVSRIVGKGNGEIPPTVGDFADQMRQIEDSLSQNTLMSTMNALAGEMKDGMRELKEEFKTSITKLVKGNNTTSFPSACIHGSLWRILWKIL